MSTLCDSQIEQLCINSELTKPWYMDSINPASVDLHVGSYYRAEIERRYIPQWVPAWATPILERFGFTEYNPDLPLWGDMQPLGNGKLLHKGESILLDTVEFVKIPEHLMAEMWLKSSAGRNGGDVYKAGYVDPGFVGTLTFRYRNDMRRPLLIQPGQRLVQMVLREMSKTPDKPYTITGRYNGQRGPTAAR